MSRAWISALALWPLLLACNKGGTVTDSYGDSSVPAHLGIGPAAVTPSGPYGERTFDVPAKAHWVNTGVFLRAGESLEISTTKSWSLDGQELDAWGDEALGEQRGCALGSLALRSGLRYEEGVSCIGAGGTYTAETDDIVYAGMIFATDLGDAYGERLRADGALQVTISSSADTVPTVSVDSLQDYPFDQVSSGWVELQSEHHVVTLPADQVLADMATAQDAMDTLDQIYEIEADMRGAAPFEGERIRWVPDDSISGFAYMLASNPVRGVSDLFVGGEVQRILRAAEPDTDIWGFAHELGHLFSFVNGTWVYQYVNLESWPNLFTIRVLEELERTENQPNYGTYCDGRDSYLAGGAYETLADDPFLQLCFLKDFETEYGASFYDDFFQGMNTQVNDDLVYDGTEASIWGYVKGRFDLAAGQDTAAVFEKWGVPVK